MQVPARGSYVPELDGVRAIAVGLVLLAHCVVLPQAGAAAWFLRHTLSKGWMGVDLFFALSGYLITSILLHAKGSPHYFRNFYARRFLRIFPLYFGLLFLFLAAGPHLPSGPMTPAWPFFTYTSNLWTIFTGREWAPLGHTWSLAIEEQFYLVYPLVVLCLNRTALRRVLWLTVGLTPFVRVATNAALQPGASYFATFCRLDVLAMGGLIALYLDGRSEIPDSEVRRLRIILAGLVTIALVLWVSKQLDFKLVLFNGLGLTVVDAAAALFICLAVVNGGGLTGRFLRWRPLTAVGRVSYGIYLLHYPILQFADPILLRRFGETWIRTAATAAVSLGATIVAAGVSWMCYERPILRLKSRFRDTQREAGGA